MTILKPDHCLAADKVSVQFGGLAALTDVSLQLYPREIVGLIGPNGAGKTTLVNCLSGFQKPGSGRVTIGGAATAGWSAADFRKKGVARTFQSGRLFADLTVQENVETPMVALGLSRAAARSAAREILTQTGLIDVAGKYAAALPYTDERRVGIARALAQSPDFILLDEPAAGMSDSECDELMEIVRAMPGKFGCGVLLIEHNMSVVTNVSDRVHVLDVGRTLATGSAVEVLNSPEVIEAYIGSDAE